MNKVICYTAAFICFLLFAADKCLGNGSNTAKGPGSGQVHKRPGVSNASRHSAAKSAPLSSVETKDGKPIWHDLKSARLASQSTKRPIFADFYTDWCSWCKIMDSTTFKDPKVEKYLAKNFVCMKLNAQDEAAGEELANKYGIDGYPTYMVFNAHGKAIGEFVGYKNPTELLASLTKLLASSSVTAGASAHK